MSPVIAMNQLILGGNGQLGGGLSERLVGAVALGRDDCDVTDDAVVRTCVAERAPRSLFNATAYNNVDGAESEADQAFAVNAVAPGRLAACARQNDCKFMHFSTDYVFGDGHLTPIDESMAPAPLSAYGRSKLLGERLALQNNPQTFVVRTTGLYSHRRGNFVATMLKYALAGRPLTVVNDQFISPTWADSLAEVAIALMQTDLYGVYHVVAQGGCSWYDLAGRTFEILDIPANLSATDQASWGAAATRPTYSVLDDAMLRATGLPRVGRWDDELERFLGMHGQALIEEVTT